MNNMLRNTIMIASVFLLMACSTTPNTQNYFILRSHADNQLVSGVPDISIRRVKLPNYFNQRGIVRENGKGAISQSNDQLWAEKLSLAIPRILARDLTVILKSPIETHPLPPSISVSTIVEVDINQFIGNDKQLVLQGSYRLVKPQKLETYRFNTIVMLPDNSTTTLVEKHSEALLTLANDIAKHLR